ncbi:MAG: four helix bundle protein [Bacteroidota bacterium]
MNGCRPHKKLLLWQEAMALVVQVYELTKVFPKEEEFGLKAQLRRASVSVVSNIAEGLARRSKNDKLHFLNVSQASLSEIDTQIEISLRLRYIASASFDPIQSQLIKIQKLLSGLNRKIQNG